MLLIGDDQSPLFAELRKTVDSLTPAINTRNIVFLFCDHSNFVQWNGYLKSYQAHNVFLLIAKDTTNLNEVQALVQQHQLKGFLEINTKSKKSVRNALLFGIRRPIPVRILQDHQYQIQTSCCCIL